MSGSAIGVAAIIVLVMNLIAMIWAASYLRFHIERSRKIATETMLNTAERLRLAQEEKMDSVAEFIVDKIGAVEMRIEDLEDRVKWITREDAETEDQ